MLELSDEALQCAYAGALALAYPSRYEGFGMPLIEAMACGCPVITAHNSAIPEVAGDAALYVDPNDTAAMARALREMQDSARRGHWIAKGYQQAKRFPGQAWRMKWRLVCGLRPPKRPPRAWRPPQAWRAPQHWCRQRGRRKQSRQLSFQVTPFIRPCMGLPAAPT